MNKLINNKQKNFNDSYSVFLPQFPKCVELKLNTNIEKLKNLLSS